MAVSWRALVLVPALASAKKKAQEGDDSAMLFFLLAMLSCVLVPWTFVVLWYLLFPGRAEVAQAFPELSSEGRTRQVRTQAMEVRRSEALRGLRSRKISTGFAMRLVLLVLLWCWLIYITLQVRQVLATSALYQNFDPYAILDVSSSSSSSQIKKAFHKLSLKYHPDKNPEASAAEKFMLAKKAYDALTDPVAKRNFRLYGNPDGPTRVELSVAMPSVSKEKQGLVLVLFLLLFVIGVPVLMLCCMQSSGEQNGLPSASNEVLDAGFDASMDAKEVQDLVLRAFAAAEPPKLAAVQLADLRRQLQSAGATFRKRKEEDAQELALQQAEALFWAHLLRRRESLSSVQLDAALLRWQAACKAILQRAAKQGMASTLGGCLEVYRALVQALEPKGSPLMQIPHFTAEQVKLWQKRNKKYVSLPAFLGMSSEERSKALAAEELALSPEQRADIDEFVACAPQMQIQEAKVFVEGEEEICMGDVATLELRLLRANLREGEAIGSAHTPHFPGAQVAEAWWVTFRLPGKGKSGVSVCSRIACASREVTAQIRFRVPLAGKCQLRLTLSCEAYAGLELEREVSYVAKQAVVKDNGSDDGSFSGSEDYD
ncbi:unnamed protein product [Effrenium voratum]|uniref:J domain-containing protein n=1 Tax=Effrenium voratum TaxID=2562239 RepID=A0AA36HKG9_9DINO|nr:unnamed protein product [Effrenium voratum]CAJ1370461.1 unnamed protein product [Effrenium voratum]CAJ1415379.1 unnamed protein product [Effrenium voratum]